MTSSREAGATPCSLTEKRMQSALSHDSPICDQINSVDEPGTQYKDRDQLAIRESSFSQNTCDLPLIQTPILVSFFRKNTREELLL